MYNDEGEDVTPRPLALIDPISIYDPAGAGVDRVFRPITRMLVCCNTTSQKWRKRGNLTQ